MPGRVSRVPEPVDFPHSRTRFLMAPPYRSTTQLPTSPVKLRHLGRRESWPSNVGTGSGQAIPPSTSKKVKPAIATECNHSIGLAEAPVACQTVLAGPANATRNSASVYPVVQGLRSPGPSHPLPEWLRRAAWNPSQDRRLSHLACHTFRGVPRHGTKRNRLSRPEAAQGREGGRI